MMTAKRTCLFTLTFSAVSLLSAFLRHEAVAQQTATPSISALLQGYPRRGRLTCQVRKRSGAAGIDVRRALEADRRALVRADQEQAFIQQTLAEHRALYERMNQGRDELLERVYYWSETSRRLVDRGRYLTTGEEYLADTYQLASDTCQINRMSGSAQCEKNESVNSGLALEQVLLYGIPLEKLIESASARLSSTETELVLLGRTPGSFRTTFGFRLPSSEVRIVFQRRGPWIPTAMTISREGRIAEQATLSDFRSFGSIIFPARMVIESPGGRENRTWVEVKDVRTGASVPDSDFAPVVRTRTAVLDARLPSRASYWLETGQQIPDREGAARLLQGTGEGLPERHGPGVLPWFRAGALFLALLGAWLLLRRPRRPISHGP